MGGATWGDGDPPRRQLHYDVEMTGDPEQVGAALGDQIADDLERLDPDGELPVTLTLDVQLADRQPGGPDPLGEIARNPLEEADPP